MAVLAALSGCTAAKDYGYYAILDRETEPTDVPSSELADQATAGVDLDTLRFATDYEGDRLYLARSQDFRGGICILVDGAGNDDTSAACSGGNWVGMDGPGRYAYQAHPDDAPPPDEGYTKLTENIYVKAR